MDSYQQIYYDLFDPNVSDERKKEITDKLNAIYDKHFKPIYGEPKFLWRGEE